MPQVEVLRWKQQRAVQVRFDDLETYVEFIESSLAHQRAKTKTEGVLSAIFHPEQVFEDDIERYQDDTRRLDEAYPQCFRASAIGMIQSTLEIHLLSIARFVASWRSIPEPVVTIDPARFINEPFRIFKVHPAWKKKMPASSREKYCMNDVSKSFVCTAKA